MSEHLPDEVAHVLSTLQELITVVTSPTWRATTVDASTGKTTTSTFRLPADLTAAALVGGSVWVGTSAIAGTASPS